VSGLWYRWENSALIIRIRVQPGASRDGIVGVHGERLKVRLRAPPVDGKANAGLIRFLAAVFGVTRSSIEILTGSGSRDKQVRVDGPRRLPDVVERTTPATF